MVKTDYFPIKIRNKFSALLLDIVVAVLLQRAKKQKASDWMGEVKRSLFTNVINVYLENPPKCIKILLDLTSEFNKLEIQGQHTNTNCVSIH